MHPTHGNALTPDGTVTYENFFPFGNMHVSECEYGWDGRIRTCNQRVNSAPLYRLSYIPTTCLVETERIELSITACKAVVIPFNYAPT